MKKVKVAGPKYRTLTVDEMRELEGLNAPAAPVAEAAPATRELTPEELAELNGVAPMPVPAGPAPGLTESALRGASQGVTLNYGDELVGAGKALFEGIKGTLTGKDTRGTLGQVYRDERDKERTANKAASDANPWAYGLGELGGSVATSFVPGLGIAKGASMAKTALQSAKLGAVSGLGASEAEDLTGAAADTAMGGLVAGGTSAIMGKILKGAPKRAVERRVGDIVDGATAKQRDKVVGAGGKNVGEFAEPGELLKIVSEKAFRKAGRDPKKLQDVTEEALNETGKALDKAYAAAGNKTRGISVSDILGDIESFATKLRGDPGKADLARAVQAKAEDVLNAWGDKTHVTAQQVRTLASDIADTAFFGSPAIAPKQGTAVSQDVWKLLKDRITSNLDEAAKAGSGIDIKQVSALNKRYSSLMAMREAVRYRATRGSSESTRARDVIGKSIDVPLALVDPTSFVAKKAWDFGGRAAKDAVDDRLATLVTMADKGNTKAQVLERALLLGLSPMVAQPLVNWIYRADRNLSGGDIGDTNAAP